MDKKIMEISWTSLWRIFIFVLFVLVLYFGRRILLGLFLSIVISSGLEFIVDFLEKRGLPRTLGVILIFLAGTLLIIITLYAVVPIVVVDLNNIFISSHAKAANTWWGPLLDFRANQSLSLVVNKISSQFLSGSASPLGALSDIVGSLVLAVSVLITSFYLTLTRDGVERFIASVFPPSQEKTALRVYERARKRIGLWFRTQVLLSITVGVLVWVSLLILGVKHAFFLGIIAGIFELVPFVGPIISGAAAVLSALTVSSALALYTLIVFLLIHEIEANVLVPFFVGRHVGLHPVIVIIALLIGAEIGGILGILIAIPSAVVFQEVLEEWSDRRRSRETAAA